MKRMFVSAVLLALPACSPARAESSAGDVLKASGAKGGLVVRLGCGDSTLTASLRADDSFLVQGLDTDPANVQLSRAHIQSLDLGGVVTARVFDGKPDFPGQHLISALATAFVSRTFSLR